MRGRRILTAAATVGVVAASLLTSPAQAGSPDTQVVGLVVTREAGTSPAQVQDRVEAALDTSTTRTPVAPGVTAISGGELTLSQARDVAAHLVEQDGIAEVSLDTRAHADAVPDDPQFGQQWALTDPTSGANAPAAWPTADGSGIVIAIIDSGVTSHEDLQAKVLPGYDFISDALVANDGDGRDSNPADPGDWISNADLAAHPQTFDGCGTQDSSWHGTHVAGLAAAIQNNGKGISGIAPGASILPVRALGKCGGSMSDIAAGITWASGGAVPGVSPNPHPADIINLSLSSSVVCQPFVQAAVDDAIGRGTVVVASAGNSAAPVTSASPAGCYDVVAVGALTRSGNRANYSNFGAAGRDLPIFAGGGSKGVDPLLSSVNPGRTTPTAALNGYAEYAGTSMAAPLVAGAAALLLAHDPALAPLAIGEHLRDTARPFPAGSTCTGSCGAGMLDAGAAVQIRPRVPAAPTAVSVQPADGSLSVTWQAPVDQGTGPITGYEVQYRPAAGQWTTAVNPWPSTLTRKVVPALTNGVDYQVRVAALNVFGPGTWTESGLAAPMGLPNAVQIRSVKYPSKTSAKVSLRLPLDPLRVLQHRLDTTSGWVDTAVAASLRVRLPKGVRRTLQVRAVNDLGASAPTSRKVATPVKPSAVRALRVKRSGKKVHVRWREPLRTGLRPRYRVRINGGKWGKKIADTRMTARGIRPGVLSVEVRTRNEVGLGPVRKVLKRK
jgi:serine protease